MSISRTLERVAIALASLALSVGLILLLSGYFAGQDQAGITGSVTVGESFPDQGTATLAVGAVHPHYDSDPPTSGPHVPVFVTRDEAPITDDQLLTALQMGDVVVMYGTRTPPAALPALARAEAGAFTPSLAAAGQAVVLARRAGTVGLTALAWAHMVRVSDAHDPLLKAFIDYWLGRGAPSAR